MPWLGIGVLCLACAVAGGAFVAWIDRETLHDLQQTCDRRARQASNMAATIRALRAKVTELNEAHR